MVAVGPASAKAALADVLAQLPLDPQHPLDAVCAGSAGISVRGTRQFLTEHLATFGAEEIPRADYLKRLTSALDVRADFRRIDPYAGGGAAMQAITQAS